jgi:hypothetical protein
MNKLMPYLIAVVATYAAIQSWKRAHNGQRLGVMGTGHVPCTSCQTNPQAAQSCCGT